MEVMSANQGSSWEQHFDAAGRAYIANRATNETRWLWQKWALNGRVFCVNVLTNDRVWQDDMTPEMRVAAGFPLVSAQAPAQHTDSSSSFHARSRLHANDANDPFETLPSKRRRGSGFYAADNEICYNRFEPDRGFGSRGTLYSSREYVQNTLSGQDNTSDRFAYDAGFHVRHAYNAHAYSSRNHGEVPASFPKAERYSSTFDREQPNTHSMYPKEYRSNVFRSKLQVQNSVALGSVDNLPHSESKPSNVPVSSEGIDKKTSAVSGLSTAYRRCPERPLAEAITSFQRRTSLQPKCKSARAMIPVSLLSDTELATVAVLYERDLTLDRDILERSDAMLSDLIATNGHVLTGTCQKLEKTYLRLTSAPKAADVRPLEVLKRALAHVKCCWKDGTHDYEWVCSQLKSIRQDLQIQHIVVSETLDAYETHARIALENSDFGEFNTCVAQLSQLYEKLNVEMADRDEFSSYRVLYNVLVRERGTEFGRMLRDTSAEFREQPCMQYAMRVRRSVLNGNYHEFFSLFVSPPTRCMATYLLDQMLDFMRSRALSVVCQAYGPITVPLAFVLTELAWVTDEFFSPISEQDEAVQSGKCIEAGDVVHSGSEKHTSAEQSFISESLDPVFAFCKTIGVKIEPSSSAAFPHYVVNTKLSKSNGVQILYGRKGFITAAGARP